MCYVVTFATSWSTVFQKSCVNIMQTLRKKTSPLKYKNETTRFLGDGVSFKAKLIGILEVSEARGDRMCQEALADLKMAIRAAGEHKQRITINIAIDGLRLRDEKTGDSLYHHPVHKISFIAQDMTDSRAFGYIFGSPDTGHRFFGIKTDKAASQVVIAMRDLFQVVFALKKKEIELAKQHLDKNRFTSSSLFSDSSVGNSKLISHENVKNIAGENKGSSSSDIKSCGTAVADLVDLELELNSLQQGLTQMERITPSDPFGSKEDPFGDSFTSYAKPILPPPPSSGRERSNRMCETNGVYSPKLSKMTMNTDNRTESNSLFNNTEKSNKNAFDGDVNRSEQDSSFTTIITSSSTTTATTTTTTTTTTTITAAATTTTNATVTSGTTTTTTTTEDWFKQTNAKNVFDESLILPEPPRDEQQEVTKQEILSQFDVFTELDPLGTGRSKPYVDKKLFFQELKNPPKKVLNDLVSQIYQKETHTFKSSKTSTVCNEFNTDPFGEDPFVKADPFAETDFFRHDPFEKEFGNFNPRDQIEACAFENDTNGETENLSLGSRISKLPTEKQSLVIDGTLPGIVSCDMARSHDLKPNIIELNEGNKYIGPHQNIRSDVSLKLEYSAEPPGESESSSTQIVPPPLPPKRQGNDFIIKPPPRPPHIDEVHSTHANNHSKIYGNTQPKKFDESPPIPVPLRKIKNDHEHVLSIERSAKQLNVTLPPEEDYLTPVSCNEQNITLKAVTYDTPPNLLPPPQKVGKKQNVAVGQVLPHPGSKSNVTTSTVPDSLDGFEITLSQLTLSGLNALAKKLNIPSNQLNNMTLVQLTNYLSNFIKTNTTEQDLVEANSNNTMPTFHVDFAANFNKLKSGTTTTDTEPYDRYAVFRELMTEEMKQFKTDRDVQESDGVKENLSDGMNNSVNNTFADNEKINDKYAALREIVENELKLTKTQNDNDNTNESNENIHTHTEIRTDVDETNIINSENNIISDTRNNLTSPKYTLIEYNTSLENKEVKSSNDSLKSPKSPVTKAARSPVPLAITEIVQNNMRLNSGSLSDVVSGSSPDIDNTGSNSEIGKKTEDEIQGEPWAIFDQEITVESTKDKQAIPSEEGVSPWSSDSKEFGNSSPPVWQSRDTETSGSHWKRHGRKDHDGWWDTSAEPEVLFYPNRRSTDSYDEEYYECYGKHRRRKQTGYTYSAQGTGGHSSSSRDVSPWEEEPRHREQRNNWGKHAKQRSFEKYRERRHVDSYDEDEDDYEYEEEHMPRHHRSDRLKWENGHERYNLSSKEIELDKWNDDWSEDRRHRRRRDMRCCLDWDVNEREKTVKHNFGRWTSTETPEGTWRDRICDDRYYSKDSQESPWEDEYSNETEEFSTPHYSTIKRTWKRPSSASEMDRKGAEFKSRYYLATGGSDGERERRYKPGRRSRSRDSQYSEPAYRYKTEANPASRLPHKTKHYLKQCDSVDMTTKKHSDRSDFTLNKNLTLAARKRIRESLKSESNVPDTFPRKSTLRCKSLFENDFVPTESILVTENFNIEHEFSESDSPKAVDAFCETSQKQSSCQEQVNTNNQRELTKESNMPQYESKPQFEDNFSPRAKPEQNKGKLKKEEVVTKENLDMALNLKRKKNNRQKLANNMHSDFNIKKSESVNIFSRESDPFDDDFFSEDLTNCENKHNPSDNSPITSDLKWEVDDIHVNK